METELRARWRTAAGQAARARVLARIEEPEAELDGADVGYPSADGGPPDLRGFDFSGLTLNQVCLAETRLEEAVFDETRLIHPVMDGAMLQRASFVGARFESGQLFQCDATGASFAGGICEGVLFDRAVLDGASFRGAHLTSCHFALARAAGASFEDCCASRVHVAHSEVALGFMRWEDRSILTGHLWEHMRSVAAILSLPSPRGADWIGCPNVRPCPGTFRAPAREAGHHAGLLAADPGDPRLVAGLGPFRYEDYVAELRAVGVSVGSAPDFLLRDGAGHVFHPAYELLSVVHLPEREPERVRPEADRNYWGLPHARGWRSALNRALGTELVTSEPRSRRTERELLRARMLPGDLGPFVAFGGAHVSTFDTEEELGKSFAWTGLSLAQLLGPRMTATGEMR